MDPVALANSGGWAVVIAMMTALGWAFWKGHVIPGVVYRREIERADDLAGQLERHSDAIEKLSDALERARRDRASA